MRFSPKQRTVLTWWRPGSGYEDCQAIICDGAVRSGKTLCTGLSFFCWAMSAFQNRSFALCGKTITGVRRNLLQELLPMLEKMGFRYEEKRSQNLLVMRLGGRKNTFYLFGGKDEGSAAYRRFVLGEWVCADGRVYDFFDEGYVKQAPAGEMEQWYISCDYGTVNPTSMGLWGKREGVWYRVREYYYDARANRKQMTDEEYASALAKLAGEREIRAVVLAPSAASFAETLRRRGWRVKKANNEVLSGIRLTAQLLKAGKLVVCEGCKDAIREFSLYRWEEGEDKDRVRKEHDHAMDEIRYFAATVVGKEGGQILAAESVERAAL